MFWIIDGATFLALWGVLGRILPQRIFASKFLACPINFVVVGFNCYVKDVPKIWSFVPFCCCSPSYCTYPSCCTTNLPCCTLLVTLLPLVACPASWQASRFSCPTCAPSRTSNHFRKLVAGIVCLFKMASAKSDVLCFFCLLWPELLSRHLAGQVSNQLFWRHPAALLSLCLRLKFVN